MKNYKIDFAKNTVTVTKKFRDFRTIVIERENAHLFQ